MSRNLEIESKSMITKADYKKLMKLFSHEEKYVQVNYYIASEKLLKNIKKYGMRIRAKQGICELTLKVQEEVGKTEITQEISRKTLAKLKYSKIFPDGEVRDYLIENNVCDPTELRIIGKMKTTRTDIKFFTSLISIDKSQYNHKTDYEVECEDATPLAASTNLQTFLGQQSIKYQKSEHNKLARFLMTR